MLAVELSRGLCCFASSDEFRYDVLGIRYVTKRSYNVNAFTWILVFYMIWIQDSLLDKILNRWHSSGEEITTSGMWLLGKYLIYISDLNKYLNGFYRRQFLALGHIIIRKICLFHFIKTSHKLMEMLRIKSTIWIGSIV